MSQTDEFDWVKVAQIIAELPYPPISAWEFEYLKTEEVVQERLKTCTVYIIGQRPLLWFDNVIIGDSEITFEITDGQLPPVTCRLNPAQIGLCADGEPLDIEVGYHREVSAQAQPYMGVAAIRIFDKDEDLKVWWSPQKLLFEALVRKLPVTILGDVSGYLEFEVHYIGRAFSQTIWDRLKAHEKYQSILIKEDIRGGGHARPALEITLFMVDIIGLDEVMFALDGPVDDAPAPILFRHRNDPTDPKCVEFRKQWLGPRDKAVTTELEALLINLFKPEHNGIHYDNYPLIVGGLRDRGYSETELLLDNCPFRLLTKAGLAPLDDADPEDPQAPLTP